MITLLQGVHQLLRCIASAEAAQAAHASAPYSSASTSWANKVAFESHVASAQATLVIGPLLASLDLLPSAEADGKHQNIFLAPVVICTSYKFRKHRDCRLQVEAIDGPLGAHWTRPCRGGLCSTQGNDHNVGATLLIMLRHHDFTVAMHLRCLAIKF